MFDGCGGIRRYRIFAIFRRGQRGRYRTARTRPVALHRIFDRARHPAAHLAQKLIRNIGELHACDAAFFIRPLQTASALDTPLFVQIESELHFRIRAHAFDRAKTKTVF
jgi:hypothetical protein